MAKYILQEMNDFGNTGERKVYPQDQGELHNLQIPGRIMGA
ncbi:MAG: hypothetical protein ACI4BA_08110 [Prevotella sp.]